LVNLKEIQYFLFDFETITPLRGKNCIPFSRGGEKSVPWLIKGKEED